MVTELPVGGRSPDGSGQSGLRPEPASRLGHTATVPNAEEMFATAMAAIAEDDDHMVASTYDDYAWLIAQIACWPTRIHEERTTNHRFLLMSAAATLLDASGMSAGTAETQSGSGLQPASPVGEAETPKASPDLNPNPSNTQKHKGGDRG